MKAVVQRVSKAAVEVDGETIGSIDAGLLLLVGVSRNDSAVDAQAISEKVAGLRIFSDAAGQMNLSVKDVSGSVLVVSQFTLYGETVRGRRPSFSAAAPGVMAEPLVESLAALLEHEGIPVARGKFCAKMTVVLVNDAPVTIIIETEEGRLV